MCLHLLDGPHLLHFFFPRAISVIDTGYGLGHEDLPNDSDHGVAGTTPDTTYGTWDLDVNSHGTHCAGTIGAIGGNDVGVTSVNPDPTKFSFFIGKGLSDSGSGSNSVILAAIEDCVANAAGAKVVVRRRRERLV